MGILLNSHLKIMKAGWVILLLSVLLFSCQKEMSENERAGQFITNLLYSVLDDQIYSKQRNEIEAANKIYGRKVNLLLVVKDFTIKNITKGKCEEFVKEGRPLLQEIDCYTVTVFFTKSHYIDLEGKLKDDGYFLEKDSVIKFELKIIDNKFKLLFGHHLGNMLSESGEKKLLEHVKKRMP